AAGGAVEGIAGLLRRAGGEPAPRGGPLRGRGALHHARQRAAPGPLPPLSGSRRGAPPAARGRGAPARDRTRRDPGFLRAADRDRRLLRGALLCAIGLGLAVGGSNRPGLTAAGRSHGGDETASAPGVPPSASGGAALAAPSGEVVGVPVTGALGITESVDSI